MKLIFIYGPPAAGKLTVAKELVKLTKYKLFHNHATVDLIKSIIPFEADGFFKISSKIRLLLLEKAAKENIDVVMTMCYNYPTDNSWIKKLIKIVEKHKGKVCFVHLQPEKDVLWKRVKGASRKEHGKLKSIKEVKAYVQKYEFYTSIPFVDSLVIDNSTVSAKEVALFIKEKYKL